MKKTLLSVSLLILLASTAFSQRILINENFETSGLNSDSLPANWSMLDADGTNPGYPFAVWHARDSGATFPGVNALLTSKSHDGHRSVSIPWRAGDPVADDWLWTDTVRVAVGDSLIFWMLLGQPIDINFGGLIDSMQVHVCTDQDPSASIQKLATIRSLDSNNVFTEYKFSLSAFANQRICVAFRYYMNTTVDGLRVCIDEVFIGNRAAIGIHQISTNLPKSFDLRQNYPNPFNPVTNIEFSITKSEHVQLIVYNELGQEAARLVNQQLNPGTYKVDFDASNLPSGVYFYRIIAGDAFTKTKKMILTK